MDAETFKSLCEVLAFECRNDKEKHKVFADVFYGDYKNESPTFIDLDAIKRTHEAKILDGGRFCSGYVSSMSWEAETDRQSYGQNVYFSGRSSPALHTVKIELKLRI